MGFLQRKIQNATKNIRTLKKFLKENRRIAFPVWLKRKQFNFKVDYNSLSDSEKRIVNRLHSVDLTQINHIPQVENAIDVFIEQVERYAKNSKMGVFEHSSIDGMYQAADDYDYPDIMDDGDTIFSNARGKKRREARREARKDKRETRREAKKTHDFAFDWTGGQTVGGKLMTGLHLTNENHTVVLGETVQITESSAKGLIGSREVIQLGSSDGSIPKARMMVINMPFADSLRGSGKIHQPAKSKKDARQAGRAAKKETKGELLDKQRLKDKARLLEAKSVNNKELVKKEKQVRRERIKEKAKKIGKFIAKIMPMFATVRGIILGFAKGNVGKMASKLYPAFITEEQAINLGYGKGAKVKAEQAWAKAKKRFEAIGGKGERLQKALMEGHKKRPKDAPAKYTSNPEFKKEMGASASFSGFSGNGNLLDIGTPNYTYGEVHYGYSGAYQAAAIASTVAGVLGSLLGMIAKLTSGKEPDSYEPDNVNSSPIEEDGIIVTPDGKLIEAATGRLINPDTGETMDVLVDAETGEVVEDNVNILGMPKPIVFTVVGLGAATALAVAFLKK